jgi:hypothetical protein
MDGCVNTGGRLEGPAAAGGSGPAPGPEGGASDTAAPGSGTDTGGTGGGRSLKSWAFAGKAEQKRRAAANASAGHSHLLRRHRKMPSPPVFMSLLFTENAANSSHRLDRGAPKEPVRRNRIDLFSRDPVILPA